MKGTNNIFDLNNVDAWKGKTGTTGGYVNFDTKRNAIRAGVLTVQSRIKAGNNTPASIAKAMLPKDDLVSLPSKTAGGLTQAIIAAIPGINQYTNISNNLKKVAFAIASYLTPQTIFMEKWSNAEFDAGYNDAMVVTPSGTKTTSTRTVPKTATPPITPGKTDLPEEPLSSPPRVKWLVWAIVAVLLAVAIMYAYKKIF